MQEGLERIWKMAATAVPAVVRALVAMASWYNNGWRKYKGVPIQIVYGVVVS